MAFKKNKLNGIARAEQRKRREKKFPSATRNEIEEAMTKYLAEGGKITRIEPEWIEEGELYIFS
ncbi:MAG: hypothetical protein HN580_17980 [Deltaproteobacteria bacterium]|mgnify:CR=1 FL=1|jgi:hypothetical protein|nr:hypothetical protein [Deltaproteobacteria bacterium]MBT4090576.1 hypothetical protein [Deltaproteobacteria bacterium]MBT4263201.1 hypothetical protein [Deltaproteobacteria bacterium]MBT4640949.1 hypothetical protein [Deltaproteobacteria bacterium]MBT6501832.1 hypothetical protein [Deltaproteobacteria bacterium]